MIYLYIKPEVKKNDTTAMNTALNEVYVGSLHENCHLVRGGVSSAGNKQFSCCWTGFSSHLQGFPQRFGKMGDIKMYNSGR